MAWSLLAAFPEAVRRQARAQGFRTNEGAQVGLGPIMGVVGGVVTFVVVLLVLAAFSSDMFGAVQDINENVTSNETTTGSTEVDGLKPVFGILIAIGFLLALVTAILGAASYLSFRRD